MPTYRCPRCGTEYIEKPAECDWCGIPVLTDDCPDRLERLAGELARARPKARMWDMLEVTAHRFGVKVREVIEFIKEKVK